MARTVSASSGHQHSTPPVQRPARGWAFHGWRVVSAGAVMQALLAGLFVNAYGSYAVVLRDNFGWSTTTLASGFSFTRFESALMGPIQGWALDRFRIRTIMRVGVVLIAAGFFALSQISTVLHLFIALGILSAGAALAGFLSVTTAVVRWFERRRARALALGSMGFAVGGFMTPAVVFLLEQVGWRTAMIIFGFASGIIGWLLTDTFAGLPADRGHFVDGEDPDNRINEPRAEGVSDIHLTGRQALRTRAFWMISLGHASALLVVGAVMTHLSLYLVSEHDFTLQQASWVAGAVPLFQMAGMFIGGLLGDQINKRFLAAVAMVGHMGALLLLTYATSSTMIWMFVPIQGLAWGVRGPLMQALRADYFGSTYFGQIMGYSALVIMLGSVGGPLLAGVLKDVTGSYRMGFTIIAAIAGLGLVFFALATPPQPVTGQHRPLTHPIGQGHLAHDVADRVRD